MHKKARESAAEELLRREAEHRENIEAKKRELRAENLTYDELLEWAAVESYAVDSCRSAIRALRDLLVREWEALIALDDPGIRTNDELVARLEELKSEGLMTAHGLLTGLPFVRRREARTKAKKRHSRTDDAKDAIRAIWASGKYSTKQRCAEEEYAALGIAYDTALKALRNAPSPQASASTG